MNSDDSAICDTCATGFTKVFDGSCFNCTEIYAECSNCVTQSICTECTDTTKFAGEDQCFDDPPYCTTPKTGDATKCAVCDDGKWFLGPDELCIDCGNPVNGLDE